MTSCISGEILIKESRFEISLPICLVGESFYIQLFIDYNLFECSCLFVCDTDRNYWSKDIDINYLTEKEVIKSQLYIIYCGFDIKEKNNKPYSIDCDFFDISSVRFNGIFKYNEKTYIVDDVKYVASNPEYMKRAYPRISGNLFDYLQDLAKVPAGRRVDKNGQICLWDYKSIHINQVNGRRITINVPKSPIKRIHVFGDSRVSGYMIEDCDLFSNILQGILNENNHKYEVINYGIPGREINRMQYQVEHAEIKRNDIVVIMTGCYEYREHVSEHQLQFAFHMKKINEKCISLGAALFYINLPVTVEMITPSDDELAITDLYHNYKFKEYSLDVIEKNKRILLMTLSTYGIRCHDMAIAFNRPHEELLFINMHHYSPAGNRIIAQELYDLIETQDINFDESLAYDMYEKANELSVRYARVQQRKKGIIKRTKISLGGIYNIYTKSGRFRLKIWLHGIIREICKKRGLDRVYGAIVMNANPFTLGHKYLVEYASKEVDHLYVFVLEEDVSEFSYDDRLHMVYLGCKEIRNVTVTSGGQDVISNSTFPEYFMKKELQSAEINAYKDIERFACSVAAYRKISRRYFGEEPLDNVTRQYNEQMKIYLPRFCIEAVEIPRKAIDDCVVSATKVREALNNKDWEKIQSFVPETTYKYLRKII